MFSILFSNTRIFRITSKAQLFWNFTFIWKNHCKFFKVSICIYLYSILDSCSSTKIKWYSILYDSPLLTYINFPTGIIRLFWNIGICFSKTYALIIIHGTVYSAYLFYYYIINYRIRVLSHAHVQRPHL